jgi:hypothetical protein
MKLITVSLIFSLAMISGVVQASNISIGTSAYRVLGVKEGSRTSKMMTVNVDVQFIEDYSRNNSGPKGIQKILISYVDDRGNFFRNFSLMNYIAKLETYTFTISNPSRCLRNGNVLKCTSSLVNTKSVTDQVMSEPANSSDKAKKSSGAISGR